MRNFIRRIIYNQLAGKNHTPEDEHHITPFRFAKAFREFKLNILLQVKSAIMIILGISSAAFGLESFLIPNDFIDGGATGIAMLITEATSIPFPVWLTLINTPFIYLAYRIVGPMFAFKTATAILTLAIVLATVPFGEVTHDKLLVAVFGGFFLGAGIGLAVRGGSVLDGTEVLALFLSRRMGATLGDIIMMVNILVFSIAALMLSVESALYSMITYLAAYKTVDFVIEGIEEYIGVTIISPHFEDMRQMIIDKLGRGVTVYVGKRGFGKQGETIDVEIIYSVITRLEISRLKAEIEKIDPNAFVVMSSVKETKGGMIKKRPLH
ncbi:MAG: YitT family protein [Flavobacteriales bacterium]|nr:YitT family protein [Flavobacteriales bacterium]